MFVNRKEAASRIRRQFLPKTCRLSAHDQFYISVRLAAEKELCTVYRVSTKSHDLQSHTVNVCNLWAATLSRSATKWGYTKGDTRMCKTSRAVSLLLSALGFLSYIVLLLLLSSSSSSSSSSSVSPLCRVSTLVFLRQTMSLGNTVLQLF